MTTETKQLGNLATYWVAPFLHPSEGQVAEVWFDDVKCWFSRGLEVP